MARNPMIPFRPGGGMFPGDPFLSLHREMNRLFDDAFRGIGLPAATGSQGQGDVSTFVHASMNVSETDKEIRITAELPGVGAARYRCQPRRRCAYHPGREEVRA